MILSGYIANNAQTCYKQVAPSELNG